MNSIIKHYDKLGQPLLINDFVAFPYHNHLEVGLITKLNAKMVRVKKIEPPKRWGAAEFNRYPSDCVKVEGPIVSMYIIKNSGAK